MGNALMHNEVGCNNVRYEYESIASMVAQYLLVYIIHVAHVYSSIRVPYSRSCVYL